MLLIGGIVIGSILTLGGIYHISISYVDIDEAERTIGKIALAIGLALAGGGIGVIIAEARIKKTGEESTKTGTPVWAYIFVFLCCTLLLGGAIGGICAAVAASMILGVSRIHIVSAPRRIYASFMILAFAWAVYFALARQVASSIHP